MEQHDQQKNYKWKLVWLAVSEILFKIQNYSLNLVSNA